MGKEKIKKIDIQLKNVMHHFVRQIVFLIPNSKIMLFGSYAKGSFSKDSDIDIAVFLPPNFSIDDIVTINRLLCKISGNYDNDIQTQVFLQDELLNPIGIVEEIIEYGIDLTEFNEQNFIDL